MGSPCLTPTAESMGSHLLVVSLDGLPYACNVQQRRLGELLLDGRDKVVSVDGVEGVLEVERDMRTLLWSRSKVFWTSCTTFFCSAQDAHTELDRHKDSRGGARLLMWVMMAELTIL